MDSSENSYSLLESLKLVEQKKTKKEGAHTLKLEWKDLSCSVIDKYSDTSVKRKVILDEVRGFVCSGQILAILGPSGSGKTSLLNLLSQRCRLKKTGEILLNGTPLLNSFCRNMGYVSQDDLFLEHLTVLETLSYSARLKLRQPWSDIKLAVNKTLQELDLWKVKDSLVGSVGNGISGGERRRLTIANEIVDEPVILLLDEPTSGLDSATALLVVSILKRLAVNRQVATVCTIHQPRLKVIKMFDNICLLAMGKVVYFGETVPMCLDYFSKAGYVCPDFENPADWMLDLVNNEDLKQQDYRDRIIEKLARQFWDSKHYGDSLGPAITNKFKPTDIKEGYRTSFYNQVNVLTRRNLMFKMREPSAVKTQLFNATIMPLMIGGIYFNLGHSQSSIQDRMSMISLSVVLQAFAAYDTILLFPQERKLYLREQTSGLYRTTAYILSKLISEHPIHSVCACIAATIFYWMVGLQNELDKFAIWVLFFVLVGLVGASTLMTIGTFCKTMEQGNMVASLVLILFMMLDGHWVSLDRIPDCLRWITKLSFNGLAVEAAIYNEFSGIENFQCVSNATCFYTGEEVLEYYDFENVSIKTNILILGILFVGWKALTYLGVRFLHTGYSFRERLNS